jgi:UDP-N-acetyl-2-amino-2-deoxyglucuronate dehydrogenase
LAAKVGISIEKNRKPEKIFPAQPTFPLFLPVERMNAPIRYLLVGAGNIGARHAAQIRRTGLLVGVCDLVREKALHVAQTPDIPVFESLTHMLASVEADILVVCTPNGCHIEHSRAGLEAGRHVLCEKPLSIGLDAALSLAPWIQHSQKKLWIVKQNRFNPPVAYVHQLLQNKQLGAILGFHIFCAWNRPATYYQHNWHGSVDLDGGSLYTQFSHFIDLLCWWLGPHERVLHACMRQAQPRPEMQTEDTGMATIQMKQGAVGTLFYTVNAFKQNMEGAITLFGEQGTIKIGGQYLNELSYHCVNGLETPILPQSLEPNQYANYQGSMSNHPLVYDALIEEYRSGHSILPQWKDGLPAIALMDEIYRLAN